MNIKWLNNSYDEQHIDALLTALASHDTSPVTLICTDITPQFQDELFKKINELTPKLTCRIQWMTEAEGDLIPLHSFQRQQFALEMHEQIKVAEQSDEGLLPPERTIRKAKKDLVAGKSNARGMPLQQQQQQQQQQQVSRTRIDKRVYAKVIEEAKTPEIITPNALQDLITRDNIETKLSAFYEDLSLPESNKPTLVAIWDSLVGKGAQYLEDKSKTITGITQDAMQEIIRHHAIFSYGIVLDNPPAFLDASGHIEKRMELRRTEDNKQYILRFADEPTKTPVDKFTLIISQSFSRPDFVEYERFYKEHDTTESTIAEQFTAEQFTILRTLKESVEAVNAAFIAKQFTILRTLNESFETVKTAFEFFCKPESLLIKIKTILEKHTLSFDIQHYSYLADMLIYSNAAGVLLFLQQLLKLKDSNQLEPFLGHASNYLQWASKEGLERLESLAKFNDTERTWWSAMIIQHQASGAPLDFNRLFDAFEDFRIQIHCLDKDNHLPTQYPFSHIPKLHMQTALERALYIIKHGPVKEQVRNLKDLDLGPTGAYFFSRYEQSALVSRDMVLSPEFLYKQNTPERQALSYAMHDESTFKTFMNLREPQSKIKIDSSVEDTARSNLKELSPTIILSQLKSIVSGNSSRELDQALKLVIRNLEQTLSHPVTPSSPVINYDDTKRFYYRYIARPIQGNLQPFSLSTYRVMVECIDELSRKLTPRDNGAGFYLRGTATLPPNKSSGYVCIETATGELSDLYFIDNNASPIRTKLNVSSEELQSLIIDLQLNNCRERELTEKYQKIITNYTKHTPEKNEHHDPLDVNTKASLLYISAIAGSGVRACNQNNKPNDELPKFLAAVRDYSKKTKVPCDDIIAAIHDCGLSADTCPTLGELGELFKLIPIPKQDCVDKEAAIKEIIAITLGLITDYGDVAQDVFDNYKARLVHQKKTQANESGLDYIPFVTNLRSVRLELENQFKYEPQTIQSIVRVLSLINAPLLDKEAYQLQVQLFVGKIKNLKFHHQVLLELLCDIDISGSKQMFSFDEIHSVLDEISRESEQYAQLADPKKLKSSLLKTLRNCLPDVRIGRAAVEESAIDLISIFRAFATDFRFGQIEDIFKIQMPKALANAGLTTNSGLGGYITEKARSVLPLIKEFYDVVTNEKSNEWQMLELFDQANEALVQLRDELREGFRSFGFGLLFDPFLSGLAYFVKLSLVNSPGKQQVAKYFETMALSVFAEPVFNEKFTLPMQDTIESLETKNNQFNSYLSRQICGIKSDIGFGLIEVTFDPTSKEASNKVQKLIAPHKNALILFNKMIYRVEPAAVDKVSVRQILGSDSASFDKLRLKIKSTYTSIGKDGFCLITVNDDIFHKDAKKATEDYLKKLYELTRCRSLGQDAIIMYKGELYYSNRTTKKVEKITQTANNTDAINTIKSKITKPYQQAEVSDYSIITQLTDSEIHNEVELITALLGNAPILSVSEVFNDYGIRVNRLNVFINSLIRLRNKNKDDYQKCLDILFKNNSYEQWDFKDLSRMFGVFSKLKSMSVVEQLDLVMAELNKYPPESGNKARLGQVLAGLELLSDYQQNFDEDQIKQFFKMSVAHNLQHDHPFPLDAVIDVQKNCPESSAVFLKQFIRVLSLATSSPEISPNNDFMGRTTHIIKEQGSKVVPYIVLLLQTIQSNTDLNDYFDLLGILPTDPTILAKWSVIFEALDLNQTIENPVTLTDVKNIVNGLEKLDQTKLTEMCDVLFDSEPYPENNKFIQALTSGTLESFQIEFDRHPYGVENWSKMQASFDTTSVVPVIGGIRRLLDNQYLSETQQVNLKLQFDYVNAIGQDHSFYPCDHKGKSIELTTEDGTPKNKFKLNECSRKELRSLAKALKDAFQAAESASNSPAYLSDPKHRTLTLQLLAVMREQYYRSTGRVPNSTQMLSLIYSLDNPERQLFGINTGEGKSITTALFSVLLAAKGGTVHVPTANRTLVRQDYYDKHNDRFFKALDIKSSVIGSGSKEDSYCIGGINYGTVGDLSNFCSRAELEGWSLDQSKDDGKICPMYLVMDEYDYTMDDRTQFKYSVPVAEDQQGKNPHAWIYTAVNQFVQGEKFRNVDPNNAWDEAEDVRRLKLYLEAFADTQPGADEKKQHIVTWAGKLNTLIDSACDAQGFVEGRDFAVSTQDEHGNETGYSVAVPFNESGVPQHGGTYLDGRHPCLHAHLQKTNKSTAEFPIDPEPVCIATRSSMAYMRLFSIMIGLTGTPGTDKELLEQQDKYGMYAFSIPQHKQGNCAELMPRLVTQSMHDQAIIDAIKYAHWEDVYLPYFVIKLLDRISQTYLFAMQHLSAALGRPVAAELKKQPILLITKDKNRAEALYDKLVKEFGKERVQKISGMETDEQRAEMLKIAARDNKLTVGTPLLGRGTDIDPKHVEGLFVIQTCLDTPRNTRQIKGRAARKGQNGKYLAIYEGDGFSLDGYLSYLVGSRRSERERQIEAQQEKLNEESAIQRYYLQEIDEIQQVVFNQFDAWKSALFGENGTNRGCTKKATEANQDVTAEDVSHQHNLNNQLMQLRGELIQALNDCWNKCLRDSGPELINLYVRRKEDGSLEREKLDAAQATFEKEAVNIWKQFQIIVEDQIKKYPLVLTVKDKARIGYLKNDDLTEELTYRKLRLHRDRVNTERACRLTEARTKKIVELASNPAWAVLHFDGGLMKDEAMALIKEHAVHSFEAIINYSSFKIKLLDNKDNDVFKRIEHFISELDNFKPCNIDEQLSLQSTVIELVKLYEAMEEKIQFQRHVEQRETSSERKEIPHSVRDDESVVGSDESVVGSDESVAGSAESIAGSGDAIAGSHTAGVGIKDEIQECFFQEPNALLKAQLNQLKLKHINNLSQNLAADICKQFAWAKNPKSFYCTQIEYSIVTQAAQDLWKMADAVVHSPQDDRAISALHKALCHYEMTLKSMWYYFPFGYFFGYPDTRQVIAQALAQFDCLVQVGGYAATAHHESYEAGKCQAYLYDFWSELAALQVTDTTEWTKVVDRLKAIQEDNDGLAVVDELLHYLQHQAKDKFVIKPDLLTRFSSLFISVPRDPIPQLIKTLSAVRKNIEQDNPGVDPVRGALFLSKKEAKLRTSLKCIFPTNKFNKLEIKPGHTGFNAYFDLVIQCDDPIEIAGFSHDPRRKALQESLRVLNEKESAIQLEWTKTNDPQENVSPTGEPPILRNELPAGQASSSRFRAVAGIMSMFKTTKKGAPATSISSTTRPLASTGDLSIKQQIASWQSQLAEVAANKAIIQERLDKCAPNLMTRRFDSLGDLLDFEAELRSKVPNTSVAREVVVDVINSIVDSIEEQSRVVNDAKWQVSSVATSDTVSSLDDSDASSETPDSEIQSQKISA
ncbi:MAG: hypothetical protein Q8R83_05910 [Legionellaceae bacterium]|nr:hypothetical protein [Legionellaceae bacterium]